GVSVASGIAPFRGPGGLWTDRDIEQCATARALRKHPERVWKAFADLRRQAANTKPNATHFALAELEKHRPSTMILTQNIDGLHQSAGSKNVIELHGNIHRTRCTKCDIEPYDDTTVEYACCSKCGAPLRYDIVLFEENLDAADMEASYEALGKCDLFIAAGTSGIVWPSAGFAQIAKRSGARTVLVNLETLYTEWFDEQILGKAEEIFPKLFDYQGVDAD
ncbi:NAD-dependent deacylase, partial [bacterium]|nr:NAD-dependent deacylase [bacterium]